MKARQHMLCPIFTIIITCVCLLLSEETSAEKFLEFYSKDADDAMLTADASILADLERHFDDFVSEKLPVASRSTLASLKNELAGSFAENERLQRAFDGSKKKKSILENLAELFEVVGLFKNGKRTKENEIINEILDSLKEQIAALRRTGRKNAGHTKEDLITMKEDEGFNNEIIEVLFFKTAMRRKALKKGHLVDVVSRVGYHYTVPLREVVDEIVWLCELGGCVNANRFNPVGWFGRRKLQSELHSETLYSRLCIVRVKVLLYIAYLQESRLDYKERSFREKLSNKINCGPKSFVGVLSLAAIIAAAGYHHFLKSASASSRANGSNEQPSWPPPLTTEWTILGMSTSAAALTALGAVCLLGGGFAYYSYYADSTSEMADNGEHNDGNEGNEKGAGGGGGSSDQQTTTGGLRSTISSVVFSALGMSKEEKKKKRKKPKEKMMGSAFSKHASSVDDTEEGVRREGPPGKQNLRTASSAIFSKVAKTKIEKVNEEEEEENEEDAFIKTTKLY
ncbi:hypothetical protein TYRP_015960 [Tyrophagus putrescentiae]|nr:hypothetical protein TYRP_015960 [Tyrophagus putrescentiae]